MAEPLEFQILQSIQTALRNISIAGGYFHDVASVAVKLDADAKVEDLIGSSPERPFIILEINTETFDYFPAEQLRLIMPVTVHFVNDTDPKEDDDLLKSHLRACADVEQALAIDGTRGGLATDTRITSREKREYEGQLLWSQITAQVLENRTYGKPNG